MNPLKKKFPNRCTFQISQPEKPKPRLPDPMPTLTLKYGIRGLVILLKMGWLNWANKDYLQEIKLISWSFVNTIYWGKEIDLNSPSHNKKLKQCWTKSTPTYGDLQGWKLWVEKGKYNGWFLKESMDKLAEDMIKHLKPSRSGRSWLRTIEKWRTWEHIMDLSVAQLSSTNGVKIPK